jgi:2,3-bisphosphoglycerate-independent phosphoglycerate mutase
MPLKYKPVVLVVLDGWGEWNVAIGNPLVVAKLPTIAALNQYYPKILLEASGISVGLPWGVMGNSEVGHQTMGVGQIVFEPLPTIDMAIQGGSFFKNRVLKDIFSYVKDKQVNLHIWGLMSDGGVHSRLTHLFALLDMARREGLNKAYIHAVMDGRDTPPSSGQEWMAKTMEFTKKIKFGQVATVIGRYWAMDRNQNWDRVEKAAAAWFECQGDFISDPLSGIANQYQKNVFDEYLEPMVVVDQNGLPVARIKDGDAVICFNFRGDRARQMTRALTSRSFREFKKAMMPANVKCACFTSYEKELTVPVAFPPHKISTRLGEILSAAGHNQLRIAETEKYAHVTYFFNGGKEEPFPGEDRILVASKNAPSYATVPEMSAAEITDRAIGEIKAGKHDFVLLNYANPDMVGHTGVFNAGVKAVETVDRELKRLIEAVLQAHGCLVVTADHGNIEEMINVETGGIDTKHSTNPVPCWLVRPDGARAKPLPPELLPAQMEGMLADVTPTVLELLGHDRPDGMTGHSLLPLFDFKQ